MSAKAKNIVILGASSKVWRLTAPYWFSKSPHRTTCVGRSLSPGIDLTYADLGKQGAADVVVSFLGTTKVTPRNYLANKKLALLTSNICAQLPAKGIIFASSGAIYGAGQSPHDEYNFANSDTLYGRSKREAERVFESFPSPSVSLRLANIAGADSLFSGLNSLGFSLERFPNGLSARRSYLSPEDLAQVLLDLVDRGLENTPNVLNLAGPEPVSMIDIVKKTGRKFDLVPAKKHSNECHVLDVTRLGALGLVLHQSSDPAHLATFASSNVWSHAA